MAAAPRPVVCALAACLAAAGASAGPIFTATPEGDWFDGTSWSGGVAPGATSTPVVDNGGTAVASSESPLYPGAGTAVEAASLAVGSRLDASAPEDANGAVALTDVDLVLGGNLWVGSHESSQAGTASGSLGMTGGEQTAGDATIGGEVHVGVLDAEGSGATGSLYVSGDLEANGFLAVGVNGGSAELASGEAGVSGDVRLNAVTPPGDNDGRAQVDVGTNRNFEGDPPAQATTGFLSVGGDLEALYGTYDATRLSVGAAQGPARADGRVEVDGDLIGFRSIEVGVAAERDPPSATGPAIARGALEVAGTLGAVPDGLGGFNQLSVGVTRASPFGTGDSSAMGEATFGAVEAARRLVEVGIAGAGPATGSLQVGSGDLGGIQVGISSSNADAVGHLTAGGNVIVATVGSSQGSADTTGNAIGSASISGFASGAVVGVVSSGGTAVGELDVEGIRRDGTFVGPVSVGINGAGAGTAEGAMRVRSGGIDARTISVGRTIANGSATGVLETSGDVHTNAFASLPDGVGHAFAQATGHADGTWILHDGTYTTRRLVVGLSEGAGTATGRVVLDHMQVDTDDLTLGDGAKVEIQIADLLTYSAIDAGVAKLDGDLRIVLMGATQNGIYDLLVSGGPDGITGDFDSVELSSIFIGALGPDQHVSWGIENVAVGGTTVEVFRMHVVPEPGTGALLALGVVTLAVRSRRAR